jgi:hypothetical protein
MTVELLQQLESVLGKGRRTTKNNYIFFSPFINHRKPKLEINLDTNSQGENEWHCWVSDNKGKTLKSLLRQCNTPLETQQKILSLTKKDNVLLRRYQDKTDTSIRLPAEFKALWVKSRDPEYRNALNYILNVRKLSVTDIIKYQIGYCDSGKYKYMIIIPSFDYRGQLNFYIGRSYYDAEIRFRNVEADKNIIGFESHINWNEPITIVESALDAIAVKRNAIPLFGKTILPKLKEKIITENVTRINLALDPDAIKQSLRQAEYFMSLGIEVNMLNLQDQDPSAIGFVGMTERINDSEITSWGDIVIQKLFV